MKRLIQCVSSAMGIWTMEMFVLYLIDADSINRYTVITTSMLAILLAERLYKSKEET